MPAKKSKGAAPASNAPALTDADRELLALAAEVEKCAQSARNVVLQAHTQAHLARFGSVEAQKQLERRRMARMLLAWRGIGDEDAAPYRDARMLLASWVFFYAAEIRNVRELERRREIPLTLRGGNDARLAQKAEQVARIVAQHYPTLAAKLAEPDRIERIRAAIASAATSTRRKPWKLIARTWDGIDAGRSDETWRQDWARYMKRS